LRAGNEVLQRMDKAARVQIALAAHVRAITDGLAWKALGYDRAAITVLGRGVRVDRLADDGVGLQAELVALGALSDLEDAVTIHNDLATVLRHGDLTTIYPTRRRVEIREIKATAAPGEHAPQTVRLSAATELINDGNAVDPRTGRTEHLHRLAGRSRTYLSDLSSIIEESRDEGYAHRVLGPLQHVTVIDYRVWAGREHELGARDAEVRRQLGWEPRHKTFEWLSSFRRMRDRRTSFGSLAPLPIFPLRPDDIADVMLGYMEMRTMLRGDLLEQEFAVRGIAAEVEFGSARDDVFLRVERQRVSLTIPPPLREQMLLELLTPETAIDIVSATLDLLDADAQPEQDFLPAIDEPANWA
jgi:hypothetical protein